MLFAPSHHLQPTRLPTRLSPLSPLAPNAARLNTCSPRPGMTAPDTPSSLPTTKPSIPAPPSTTQTARQPHQTPASRAVRPTPLSCRTRDQQRQRQRDQFLRRVEQTRDDARWRGRSEEMLRWDHFALLRRRREAYELQGGGFELEAGADADRELEMSETREAWFEDGNTMLSSETRVSSSYQAAGQGSPFQIWSDVSEYEAETVAREEQLEVEEWSAFLATAQHHNAPEREFEQAGQPGSETQTTDYQDNEYDDLFMSLLDQHQPSHPAVHDPEMDMS